MYPSAWARTAWRSASRCSCPWLCSSAACRSCEGGRGRPRGGEEAGSSLHRPSIGTRANLRLRLFTPLCRGSRGGAGPEPLLRGSPPLVPAGSPSARAGCSSTRACRGDFCLRLLRLPWPGRGGVTCLLPGGPPPPAPAGASSAACGPAPSGRVPPRLARASKGGVCLRLRSRRREGRGGEVGPRPPSQGPSPPAPAAAPPAGGGRTPSTRAARGLGAARGRPDPSDPGVRRFLFVEGRGAEDTRRASVPVRACLPERRFWRRRSGPGFVGGAALSA